MSRPSRSLASPAAAPLPLPAGGRSPLGFAVALALLGSGCLQGVPDDIGCLGDDTCPTGYFCTDTNLCVELTRDDRPPQLAFVGVGTDPGAANGQSLTVPLTGLTFFLSLSNTGARDASSVSVTLNGPACADLRDPTMGVAVLARSGAVVSAASMNPVLPCPDADVGVTLDLTQGNSLQPFHRITAGTFRVHVGP